MVDVGVLTDAVRWIQDKVWVDRLEATIEAHTMAAAQVRENCTIPGTSVRTAWLCRDKPSMKEALRAAGVPTAASAAVTTAAEVHDFAAAVGYPLILKPRTGAGALDTMRVDGQAELDEALGRFGGQGVDSIAVEEFVEGHEGFYDTVSVDGHVALDFVSHYYPNVLEAMRTRWISPQFVSTNRVDSVGGLPGAARDGRPGQRGAGHRHQRHPHGVVLRAQGPEVLRDRLPAARASGAWDLYSAGNDIDIYREWANAIVHGHVAARPSRRFATGIVALRPERDGQISGYSGVDEVAGPARRVGDRRAPAAARARRPSRSRPATWPTPTSACATPTTTCCAACSTTSAAPSTSTPRDPARSLAPQREDADDVRVIVLGPQRRPTLDAAPADWPRRAGRHGHRRLAGAGVRRRRARRGCSAGARVNLRLHARWLDVLERDPEYAAAEREHRAVLDELQELYLVQLDGVLRGAAARWPRYGGGRADGPGARAGRRRGRGPAGRRAAPGPGAGGTGRRSTAAWRPEERPRGAGTAAAVARAAGPAPTRWSWPAGTSGCCCTCCTCSRCTRRRRW